VSKASVPEGIVQVALLENVCDLTIMSLFVVVVMEGATLDVDDACVADASRSSGLVTSTPENDWMPPQHQLWR